MDRISREGMKVHYPIWPDMAYPEFRGKGLLEMLAKYKPEETMIDNGCKCAKTSEPVALDQKHWVTIRVDTCEVRPDMQVWPTKIEAEKGATLMVEKNGGEVVVLEAIAIYKAEAKPIALKSK